MTETAQGLRAILAAADKTSRHQAALISEAFNELNRLEATGALKRQPRTHTCRRCLLAFHGDHSLQEHIYASHDGPLPDHWAAADQLAARSPVDGLARAQSLVPKEES